MIGITGANGLLGSFIVRELIEQQRAFVAIKRQKSDITLLNDVAGKIQWRDADVLNPLQLEEAFKHCTHVIHAAAVVSFNPGKANEIMKVNVEGTRNVVNACLQLNIMRLVHISSVAALGRQKEQTVIQEDNKWVDNPLNSVYADSKYLAELEVFRGQEEGLGTVILNPSVILASANWNRSSAQLFKYVKQQKPFYIDARLNYVDVRDVASCAYRLLNSDYQAQRFIASAGSISYKDFFEKVAHHFNTKPPTLKVTRNILSVLRHLETIRSWLTRSEPVITKETARLVGSHFHYDNKKITNFLDFEFESIDNTIEWCCDYYKKKINSKK